MYLSTCCRYLFNLFKPLNQKSIPITFIRFNLYTRSLYNLIAKNEMLRSYLKWPSPTVHATAHQIRQHCPYSLCGFCMALTWVLVMLFNCVSLPKHKCNKQVLLPHTMSSYTTPHPPEYHHPSYTTSGNAFTANFQHNWNNVWFNNILGSPLTSCPQNI